MAKNSKENKLNSNVAWIIIITTISFLISTGSGYLFSSVMEDATIWVSVILLLIIIIINIIFDMIGVAVTATDVTPFVSMSSKKIRGARTAMWLVKNADKVSSFCNDVIGDICGIVSGFSGGIVTTHIIVAYGFSLYSAVITAVIGGVIAALTIGGKAMGKSLAIKQSRQMTFIAAVIMEFFSFKKKEK